VIFVTWDSSSQFSGWLWVPPNLLSNNIQCKYQWSSVSTQDSDMHAPPCSVPISWWSCSAPAQWRLFPCFFTVFASCKMGPGRGECHPLQLGATHSTKPQCVVSTPPSNSWGSRLELQNRNGYSICYFSWISSLPLDKCWDSSFRTQPLPYIYLSFHAMHSILLKKCH